MMDVTMNCAETEEGWFEVKSLISGGWGWEQDISQDAICEGTAGGSAPYKTNNHMARCGYVNVFRVNEGACIINKF